MATRWLISMATLVSLAVVSFPQTAMGGSCGGNYNNEAIIPGGESCYYKALEIENGESISGCMCFDGVLKCRVGRRNFPVLWHPMLKSSLLQLPYYSGYCQWKDAIEKDDYRAKGSSGEVDKKGETFWQPAEDDDDTELEIWFQSGNVAKVSEVKIPVTGVSKARIQLVDANGKPVCAQVEETVQKDEDILHFRWQPAELASGIKIDFDGEDSKTIRVGKPRVIACYINKS